jgi:hypothetical protein
VEKIKYLIFFSLLFALLYLEDRVFIGPLSLSNLWKISVILILSLYLFSKKIKTGFSNLDIAVLFLSLSFIINSTSIISIMDIEEVILVLILPLSYYSFYFLYRTKKLKLKKDLMIFSVFLILSAIPFLLDLIQPYSNFSESRMKFAESYQLYSKILVGFFKQPSLSSKVFVFGTIFVWAFGIREKIWRYSVRIFLFIIAIIGVYEVYRAFTRTGWIMLILFSILILFLNRGYSIGKKIGFFSFIIIGLFFIYNTNESIQNRIIGERQHNQSKTQDITQITSGRDIVMTNALNSVMEKGGFGMLIGIGKDQAIKANNGALAHNRFIEIFQYGGLVSLLFYIIYLFHILKEIKKRKSQTFLYFFCLSLYLIMIFSLLPSHGLPIWADLLFGGAIALNRIYYEENLEYQFSSVVLNNYN